MFPRFNAARALQGMTLDDLAREVGMSLSTLSQKLRGTYPLTLDEAQALRKAVKSNEPLDILFQSTEDQE